MQAKRRGTRTRPTKSKNAQPAENPSPHTSKKLLSELTDEECDQLTQEEFGDLLTEEMMYNIRTHTPHGWKSPTEPA